MYASMPDTITSVMRSAQRDESLTRKQKSFQENQHNISSSSPSLQPELPPLRGILGKRLEK
ncbi:hypothetical protein E2C01_006868 [Portunus trituberculatus]|uniref:Uncharacterized protein n=1 Tax=Portunus trituberculatus TaxID=210409 RepID=A0A5B7CYH4_PORTR|nr:hypothetical protein [Portunus trituberculatus]